MDLITVDVIKNKLSAPCYETLIDDVNIDYMILHDIIIVQKCK